MIEVKTKNRRSLNYRFTTDSKTDPTVLELKERVKAHNADLRRAKSRFNSVHISSLRFKRVVLKARGPRKTAAILDGYKSAKAYQSYLPHKHATHFDVYVADV